MPKRPPELFLVDVLVSINRINRNAGTISLKKFISDENIFSATMREFEIIGEAAKSILRFPSIIKKSDTEWQKIENYFPIQKLEKICPKISLSTSYSPVILPR